MTTKPVIERCEICIFFEPEDKFKHILKRTKAKNLGSDQTLDQVAQIMGYNTSKSNNMGNCVKHQKPVTETATCKDFDYDISKNY